MHTGLEKHKGYSLYGGSRGQMVRELDWYSKGYWSDSQQEND